MEQFKYVLEEIPKTCRTCFHRQYLTNFCKHYNKLVSLRSKSEWDELARKFRWEERGVKIQPLGEVVGHCPSWRQHKTMMEGAGDRQV